MQQRERASERAREWEAVIVVAAVAAAACGMPENPNQNQLSPAAPLPTSPPAPIRLLTLFVGQCKSFSFCFACLLRFSFSRATTLCYKLCENPFRYISLCPAYPPPIVNSVFFSAVASRLSRLFFTVLLQLLLLPSASFIHRKRSAKQSIARRQQQQTAGRAEILARFLFVSPKRAAKKSTKYETQSQIKRNQISNSCGHQQISK